MREKLNGLKLEIRACKNLMIYPINTPSKAWKACVSRHFYYIITTSRMDKDGYWLEVQGAVVIWERDLGLTRPERL